MEPLLNVDFMEVNGKPVLKDAMRCRSESIQMCINDAL